jgi:hypothetical protein
MASTGQSHPLTPGAKHAGLGNGLRDNNTGPYLSPEFPIDLNLRRPLREARKRGFVSPCRLSHAADAMNRVRDFPRDFIAVDCPRHQASRETPP